MFKENGGQIIFSKAQFKRAFKRTQKSSHLQTHSNTTVMYIYSKKVKRLTKWLVAQTPPPPGSHISPQSGSL